MKKRKEKRKYVARPGIEPRTPDLRVRCPTDCATRPGSIIRRWTETRYCNATYTFYRIILLCKSLTENLVCLYNGKHACYIDKTHLRLHENIVSFLNNNRCSYVHCTILISFQKDQGRRMGIQTDTRKHLCLNLYEKFDLFGVIYHHLYSLTHAHTHPCARALLGWDGQTQTNVHLFTQNKNKSYLRTRACGSYICYHRKKYLVKLTNIRQFVFKNVCWLIID